MEVLEKGRVRGQRWCKTKGEAKQDGKMATVS